MAVNYNAQLELIGSRWDVKPVDYDLPVAGLWILYHRSLRTRQRRAGLRTGFINEYISIGIDDPHIDIAGGIVSPILFPAQKKVRALDTTRDPNGNSLHLLVTDCSCGGHERKTLTDGMNVHIRRYIPGVDEVPNQSDPHDAGVWITDGKFCVVKNKRRFFGIKANRVVATCTDGGCFRAMDVYEQIIAAKELVLLVRR